MSNSFDWKPKNPGKWRKQALKAADKLSIQEQLWAGSTVLQDVIHHLGHLHDLINLLESAREVLTPDQIEHLNYLARTYLQIVQAFKADNQKANQ